MEIKEKTREFLISNFLFGDGSQLKDDTSFLEERIIDSTGILQILTFLEEEFAVRIQDDEILPENLDSLNNISAFLHNKLSHNG